MSGVVWALAAGVGFGVFQVVNRRANQLIDAYRGTFRVLAVATGLLVLSVVSTQDLGLIAEAPPRAFLSFAGAGVIHFFVGWTFLGLSQQRIGASRTGVAIAATPLIGSIMAAMVLDEPLPAVTVVGVVAVVVGVALIATRGNSTGTRSTAIPWYALGAALGWGTSPLFIRWGLEGLDSPLIGVTIGLASAAALYAMVLALRLPKIGGTAPGDATPWLVLAGVIIGGATMWQWLAFDRIEISIAITLTQVSTPVVVVGAHLVVGSELERLTWRLVTGMVTVVGGSVLVVLTGGG